MTEKGDKIIVTTAETRGYAIQNLGLEKGSLVGVIAFAGLVTIGAVPTGIAVAIPFFVDIIVSTIANYNIDHEGQGKKLTMLEFRQSVVAALDTITIIGYPTSIIGLLMASGQSNAPAVLFAITMSGTFMKSRMHGHSFDKQMKEDINNSATAALNTAKYLFSPNTVIGITLLFIMIVVVALQMNFTVVE